MSEKNKAAFEAFAEDYSCWAWATNSLANAVTTSDKFFTNIPKSSAGGRCGSGVLTLKLANHVDSIVGVDISPS